MTPAAAPSAAHPSYEGNWFRRSEAWLDRKGKGAWIIATVLGFIFFWPIGLFLLGYMIWSNRMFSGSCAKRTHFARHAFKTSGNSAFDAYKAETLRQLEDEQDNFEAFLKRLREAKDKAEFDQFMEERAKTDKSEDDESA